MTDCGCDKAREDLAAYVRGALEVCKNSDSDIREHLENCPACRDEATVERTLTLVVQRACRDSVAPEELKQRILDTLREHPHS